MFVCLYLVHPSTMQWLLDDPFFFGVELRPGSSPPAKVREERNDRMEKFNQEEFDVSIRCESVASSCM